MAYWGPKSHRIMPYSESCPFDKFGFQETATADLCFERHRRLVSLTRYFTHVASLPCYVPIALTFPSPLAHMCIPHGWRERVHVLHTLLSIPSFPVFRIIALWPMTTNQFTLESPEDYCTWREAGRSVKARSCKYPLDLLSLAALGIKSGFT